MLFLRFPFENTGERFEARSKDAWAAAVSQHATVGGEGDDVTDAVQEVSPPKHYRLPMKSYSASEDNYI